MPPETSIFAAVATDPSAPVDPRFPVPAIVLNTPVEVVIFRIFVLRSKYVCSVK